MYEQAFQHSFSGLNGTLEVLLQRSVEDSLRINDRSWSATSWPSWPEEGLPSKYLLNYYDSIDEAKSDRLTQSKNLANTITDKYTELLKAIMHDLVTTYTAQITGSNVGKHSAMIERADFALDKINQLRELMIIVKTQAGIS